jgi:hypothetical protein
VVSLAALVLLGGVLAVAAASGVRVYRPPKSVCVGSPIKVGVRYTGSGTQRWFRILISDPTGKKVWAKKGRAAKRWRYWGYRTKRAGKHKIVYRTPRGRRNFLTNAMVCENPAPPPAPGETPSPVPTQSPSPSPPAPPPQQPPTCGSQGEVCLSDNDADSAMFSLNNMAPGAADEACISVAYVGTVPSTVRLYGTTTGTGLDRYLDLRVTRGKYDPLPEPAFDSCANFVPDITNHVGAGLGVIYNGTLQGWKDDYGSGLPDPADCLLPPCTPEAWGSPLTPESHVYRFEISLQSHVSNAVQGQTAAQSFVWEAREV